MLNIVHQIFIRNLSYFRIRLHEVVQKAIIGFLLFLIFEVVVFSMLVSCVHFLDIYQLLGHDTILHLGIVWSVDLSSNFEMVAIIMQNIFKLMVVATNAMIPEHGHIQPFFGFLHEVLVLALHHRLVPVVLNISFMVLFVQRVSLTSLLESIHHPMVALLLGLRICPLKEKRLGFISHFCRHSSLARTSSPDLFWEHTIELLSHRDWVHGGLPFPAEVKFLLGLIQFHDLVGFISARALDGDFGRLALRGTIPLLFRLLRVDDYIAIYSFCLRVHKVGVRRCGSLLTIRTDRCPISKRSRTGIIKGKADTLVIPLAVSFAIKLLLKTNSAIGFDGIFEN